VVSCVYVCAVVAMSTSVSDPAGARTLGHASLGVSIAGIVVTLLIIAIVLGVYFTTTCRYRYNGRCYEYRDSDGYCYGVRSSDGYCYYNYKY